MWRQMVVILQTTNPFSSIESFIYVIKILPKFITNGLINNNPALVEDHVYRKRREQ